MVQLHTGCSGFYNRLLKGVFYPQDLPTSKWFEFYCDHFKTFEINSTFYSFPTEAKLKSWFKKAPDDFMYSVKAPRLITHNKKLLDCEKQIKEFYSACQLGLAKKLGCILFQLPPSFNFTEERLGLIVNSLSKDGKTVIEFRHQSWWNETVYSLLKDNNIVFCNVNYHGLPTELVCTSPVLYYRLHGNPKLFFSEYSLHTLQDIYKSINKTEGVKEAFIYFNNTASTVGIINAIMFNDL